MTPEDLSGTVSIVLGEELRGTDKLKKGIAKLVQAKPAYLREHLYDAIRALDTFEGYPSDVKAIRSSANCMESRSR